MASLYCFLIVAFHLKPHAAGVRDNCLATFLNASSCVFPSLIYRSTVSASSTSSSFDQASCLVEFITYLLIYLLSMYAKYRSDRITLYKIVGEKTLFLCQKLLNFLLMTRGIP